MNHHDLRLDARRLSSRGALCFRLDAEGSGWTVLEARDHDDVLLTRFVPGGLNGMAAAEMALKKANLLGPQRVPVAVGLHHSTLVLSMRLGRGAATSGSVDDARAELLRLAAACGAP